MRIGCDWSYRPALPAGFYAGGRIYSQAMWLRGSTHIILRNGEEFTADIDMPWSLILFLAVRFPFRILALWTRMRDWKTDIAQYIRFAWSVRRLK
jgi:hypothetical protein